MSPFLMQKYEKEGKGTAHLSYDRFHKYVNEAKTCGTFEMARRFGISEENATRTFISSVIIRRCMKVPMARRISKKNAFFQI